MKNIIPYIRRQKGIKQNNMSKDLGVSPSYLCKIENGSMCPSKSFMENCAQYLQVPVDELFPKKIEKNKILNNSTCNDNKLWNIRKKKGIKQTELARKLDCSPSYLSKIEKGHQCPSEEFRKKCAKILKIREVELFPNIS